MFLLDLVFTVDVQLTDLVLQDEAARVAERSPLGMPEVRGCAANVKSLELTDIVSDPVAARARTCNLLWSQYNFSQPL